MPTASIATPRAPSHLPAGAIAAALALAACSSGGPPNDGAGAGRDTSTDATTTARTSTSTDGGAPPVAGSVPSCAIDVGAELAALHVPGLSAGVLRKGRLACTAVAGSASLEEHRPVAPDTVFAWASVSKTVTATAAMILVDEGKLGLDDDIDDHLPFAVENPSCPTAPITVRQLMTHTSSIVDDLPVYEASYVIGDSPVALGDFVESYLVPGGARYDAAANFSTECPGAVNDYSNVAVGLLGFVVERVAGMPFDRFCDERIFAPLAMGQTSFRLADLEVDALAMPYDGDATSGFVAHGHNGFPTYPDGLLRTSVPNLARFLAMFAGLGEYDGERILAETSAQEMRRVQIPDLDDTQGLIWFYSDYGGRTGMLGHDGDDPGTSSLMFFDPATGDGAILVGNGDWYDADDESPQADALLGKLFAEAAGG